MITAIHAEWLKLRTVRAPWFLLGAGLLIVVGGISGLVISTGTKPAASLQSVAVGHLGLVAVVSLVFGTLAVAGEYRQRTITDSFLSSPRRGRVVAAKLVVFTGIGAVEGLVGAFIAVVTASIWWGAKGAYFDLGDADMWRTIAGGIIANALYAAIGVGLGALIRNLTGAIIVTIGWLAVVEGIVGQLVGTSLAKWLPFTAGRALALAQGASDNGLLARETGGFVVAAYAVVFVVIAVFSTLRRDVT
jgi:ABC-2 type transport system permease protein